MDKNYQKDMARRQQKYRIGIIVIFVLTMIIAITISTLTTIHESNMAVEAELNEYYGRISDWVVEYRSFLDMLGSAILAQPHLLEDYDRSVQYLNDIKQDYPEIATIYIANPEFIHGHAMIMDNGWIPADGFVEDERIWYTGAVKSSDDFYITRPYFDARTGEYCITFSKVLRDGESFIGVLALDFYLDSLESIMGDRYPGTEYTFLVDRSGMMINHPNSAYNFSQSIYTMNYGRLYRQEGLILLKDYDGQYRICATQNEDVSGLRFFVVKNWLSVYGNIFRYAFIYIILFGVCIIVVNLVINSLLRWQSKTNDELREVADDAIRAEKAKLQFLSNISHELRTPINAVLGMNEMILRECRDDQLRSYATNIQASGKTLLFLINDILDMSKIESGKMNVVPVNYEPGELIFDLWSVIFLRAQEKGLSLSFWLNEDMPKVLFGDDVRIKQIVTNILTNAVKYTHKGGIELRMSYANAGFKMVSLVISVRDTGIGIKKEDMNKLFESFQRLEEEKNRNIEGAGLGMSITMSLLKQMGGNMQVESEYQKGSTFTVTIPQRVIDGTPTGDFETVKSRQQQHEQDHTGVHKAFEAPNAHVLVVDDNDMNLTVVKALLNRTKIRVSTASSGQQCLEMVQKEPYHIIFMDHMMPEMDGIETLHEIKKLSDFPNEKTPVIALTANALAGAKEEYLREGFTDFLTKPIDSDLLERMIARHLPEELVQYVTEQVEATHESASESDDYLKHGISVKQGLHYSTGNIDVYLDLIDMFLRDSEREQRLTQYLNDQNMKDYSILVHSLKGNARTLGAQALADIAFEHEKDSKAGNFNAVNKSWQKLLDAWHSAKEHLAKFYQENRGTNPLENLANSDDAANENVDSGDLLVITKDDLLRVADMIDNFQGSEASQQLKDWLKSPMDKEMHNFIKRVLTALDNDFDEVKAIKLLKEG